MEVELDRLSKEVNKKKIKLRNQLSQNSLFEIYFPDKTQLNNSKGTTSFRDCIQKPSIVQLTRTFKLKSALAFPHSCGTPSICIRNQEIDFSLLVT